MSFRYCFVVALIAFAFVYVVNTPSRLGTAYAYVPSPEQAEEADETTKENNEEAEEGSERAELQREISASLEVGAEGAELVREGLAEAFKEPLLP